jgi:uncharacterized NAD(P)/FAD-binding protein YdhS
VIGAGASGTLLAVHILRRAPEHVRVVLIGQAGHGAGVAYSTRDPRHLLNVRASRMSAFEDDPDDLLRWCRDRGIDAEPDDFLPRALYGEYLQALLVRFGQRDRLNLVTGAATAVEQAPARDLLRIELASGSAVLVDAAVLALGTRPPAPLAAVGPLTPYVPDPWAHGALGRAERARRVVIVGSGLTAVDVALSVTAMAPGIEVCVVSRHGWLPRAHACGHAPAPSAPLADDGPRGLSALVGSVAAAVNADPGAWREVLDSLRPRTNDLWQQLSIDDRRLFLRDLKSWWDVHRHRMAPAVAEEIGRLQREGRLSVHAGTFQRADACGSGVRVEVREHAGVRCLDGDLLINATGPSSVVGSPSDPLVRGLLAGGYARPDALGLGFSCDPDGRLVGTRGTSAAPLFTLGPPRRGELLETVAIPEIRGQADALSRVLASRGLGLEHRSRSTRGSRQASPLT